MRFDMHAINPARKPLKTLLEVLDVTDLTTLDFGPKACSIDLEMFVNEPACKEWHSHFPLGDCLCHMDYSFERR